MEQAGAAARRAAPPAGRHQALLAPRRARGSHEGAFYRGTSLIRNRIPIGTGEVCRGISLIRIPPPEEIKHYWRRGTPVEVMKVPLQGDLAHKKPSSHKGR